MISQLDFQNALRAVIAIVPQGCTLTIEGGNDLVEYRDGNILQTRTQDLAAQLFPEFIVVRFVAPVLVRQKDNAWWLFEWNPQEPEWVPIRPVFDDRELADLRRDMLSHEDAQSYYDAIQRRKDNELA